MLAYSSASLQTKVWLVVVLKLASAPQPKPPGVNFLNTSLDPSPFSPLIPWLPVAPLPPCPTMNSGFLGLSSGWRVNIVSPTSTFVDLLAMCQNTSQ